MSTPNPSEIEIDTSQIPEYIRMDLLAIAYKGTIEYFKQPGVEEKYQKWLAERERRRAVEVSKQGEEHG